MIKLEAFKKILEIHRRALDALHRMDQIQADPLITKFEKKFWSECTSNLLFEIKEEWTQNIYSLSDELVERYLKYLIHWGNLFKDWLIEDIELLKAKLDPKHDFYEAIWTALTSSTWIIDFVYKEVDRYNEVMRIDWKALGDNRKDNDNTEDAPIVGNYARRHNEITTDQKIVLTYYLTKSELMSLAKISQDVSPQATILAAIFGTQWRGTYDKMRRTADLLTVKNLSVVLNIFKEEEKHFGDTIAKIEKDMKNAT